jgi:hypothetical protein
MKKRSRVVAVCRVRLAHNAIVTRESHLAQVDLEGVYIMKSSRVVVMHHLQCLLLQLLLKSYRLHCQQRVCFRPILSLLY